MGIPKFFRWISERYPKINQPIHSPPNPETRMKYFPDFQEENEEDNLVQEEEEGSSLTSSVPPSGDVGFKSKRSQLFDNKIFAQKQCITPEFDRLYLDMNGIVHCCSHNNASDTNVNVDPDTHLDVVGNEPASNIASSSTTEQSTLNHHPAKQLELTVQISEEEVFRNVCYYTDRIISDVAKPNELVYVAFDGVAPRAKMNQQRSRRYRSGKEKEIEETFYGAHLLYEQKIKEQEQQYFRNQKLDMDGSNAMIQSLEEEVYGVDALHLNLGDKYAGLGKALEESSKSKMVPLNKNDKSTSTSADLDVKEVAPGRFAGMFETSSESSTTNNDDESSSFDQDYHSFLQTYKTESLPTNLFHSNCITPGTEFFERCTTHLQHFLKYKLHSDPRWHNLTVIFSGPNVPGEGEHKIMDFIRSQKYRKDYNPNTRHCIFGQDGDLIMLGLVTHEPHLALLREEVIFDQAKLRAQLATAESLLMAKRKKEQEESGDSKFKSSFAVSASLDKYMHNSSFELLHMSVLRDYLAYEFETNDVISDSPFDLERTIDDFVFMTFFVGNDFLPHMPAIDIADEAFDLLFYVYKRLRWVWLKSELRKKKKGEEITPYLTNAGKIIDGNRLESFLTALGQHEDPYYDNKKRSEVSEIERIRKQDKKFGRESSIPPDEILAAKEEWDRTNYKKMLETINPENTESLNGFAPVSSSGNFLNKAEGNQDDVPSKFKPESSEYIDSAALSNIGNLISKSISITNDDDLNDLKGRYYYDKFKFSPLDAEKHLALRKAYIQGLVWNLDYYYKGCTDWDWFYPYHYGPMLSDLVDLDDLLSDISFDNKSTTPIRPFEQLMSCLPPSSAYLLPKPYQWLMKSPRSPIIDFYPDKFTVDMNGKRWPWEAVVLLPFIDSGRLLRSSRSLVTDDVLSENEKHRNSHHEAIVYIRDDKVKHHVDGLSSEPHFNTILDCSVREQKYVDSHWSVDNSNQKIQSFKPYILPGCTIPLPGYPTLKDAPIQKLIRRKLGINVFGLRSRYKTAVLQLNGDIPMVSSVETLASKFVGATVYFRYPHLQEGFVTAVSDANHTVRGGNPARRWSSEEATAWAFRNSSIRRQYETGDGLTGSGGWQIPDAPQISLSIRPLKEIQSMPDGSDVKIYARMEVEVPLIAALWSPTSPDPRIVNTPAKLEKNPYRFSMDNLLSHHMNAVSSSSQKTNVSAEISNKFVFSSSPSSKNISIPIHLTPKQPDLSFQLKRKKGLGILPPITSRNKTTGVSSARSSTTMDRHGMKHSIHRNNINTTIPKRNFSFVTTHSTCTIPIAMNNSIGHSSTSSSLRALNIVKRQLPVMNIKLKAISTVTACSAITLVSSFYTASSEGSNNDSSSQQKL